MNASAAQPVIEVNELVAHYGSRKILDRINMGGSGSGKSTLLRHLLGLNRPTSGHIRVLGVDITRAPAHTVHALRKRMGVAFQGGALFSSLTVGENIKLPLREHARLDEATMNIMTRLKLEVVNLAGFENLMPAQLSGGMIKRAAVARAIIMDP